MKKIFTALTSVLCLLLLSTSAFATTASPASGTYAPGSQRTITINASPQAGENAVTIRLNVTNMTITNFVPATGGAWIGAIAECSGSVYFTSSQVCVSLAKSSDITSGELLGTLTVTMGSAGSATIVAASGNQYSDGGSNRSVSGTIGTYTLSSGSTGTPGTLPNTSNFKENTVAIAVSFMLLIGGIAFLSSSASDFLNWKRQIRNKVV